MTAQCRHNSTATRKLEKKLFQTTGFMKRETTVAWNLRFDCKQHDCLRPSSTIDKIFPVIQSAHGQTSLPWRSTEILCGCCSCVNWQLQSWSVDWAWRTDKMASAKNLSYSLLFIFLYDWAKQNVWRSKFSQLRNYNNKFETISPLFLLIH